MAKGTAMKGMLVGGVNSNLEDSAAKAYLMSTSPAKCYVDHSESYSTNEVTIYWNSPLTYLISLTEAKSAGGDEEPVKGDVNNDGTADILDLVILKNYILGNISEISRNADISGDGNIDVNDVSLLKKIIISSK